MLKGIGKLAIITYVAVLLALRIYLPTVSGLEFNNSMDWYRKVYTHAAAMGRDHLRTYPSPEWVSNDKNIVYAKHWQIHNGL